MQSLFFTEGGLMDQDMTTQQLAELFKIMGDPTRLRIIRILLEGDMCVSHLAEAMAMGQSAISHQLRVLRTANLVTYRKEGRTAYYRLADHHIKILLDTGLEHVTE